MYGGGGERGRGRGRDKVLSKNVNGFHTCPLTSWQGVEL